MTFEPETFTPDDRTRAIFNALHGKINSAGIDEFFEVWEIESDPRKAGSVVAAAYMQIAARIAVFSAQCAGREPSREQWLALAAEQFDKAVTDVSEAITEANRDETHG